MMQSLVFERQDILTHILQQLQQLPPPLTGALPGRLLPPAPLLMSRPRGQAISSKHSHKSYRPLTVLAYRLTRQGWVLLTWVVPPLAALPPPVSPSEAAEAAAAAEGLERGAGKKPSLPEGGQPGIIVG
jgi:hypothetical protein